jgi:hypothetical protein
MSRLRRLAISKPKRRSHRGAYCEKLRQSWPPEQTRACSIIFCRAGWARDPVIWDRDRQSGIGASKGAMPRRPRANPRRMPAAVPSRPGARCLWLVQVGGTAMSRRPRANPRRMPAAVPSRPGARCFWLVQVAAVRKSRRCKGVMSAVHPIADKRQCGWIVR